MTKSDLKQINIDPDELKHFEAIASEWWKPNGKFKTLHQINPLRLGYIKNHVIDHFQKEDNKPKPYEGMKFLDVGCGGGLLAEPLHRLGADMTAIDAVEKNIKTATVHAQKSGLDINYQYVMLENLPEKETYDVITCLEVIEHVPDPQKLVDDLTARLKPGGLLFLSTINRNPKSYLFAIIGAEYILRLLPKGTHSWNKFVKPSEMVEYCQNAKLETKDITGMSFNLFRDQYSLSDDLSINYLACFNKL